MRAVILLVVFFVSDMSFAQEIPGASRDFGVAIGMTAYQLKDELLTPIRHKGTFVSLGFYHSKSLENRFREIHADFNVSPLKSRYENEAQSIALNIALNYRHLWRLNGVDAPFNLFLGPQVGLNTHLGYFEEWDESHVYWLNAYSVGFDARILYPVTTQSNVYFDVSLPLIALVSRPPERFLYKELDPAFSWFISRFHDDLTLTSVHQHLALSTSLEYAIKYTTRLKQGFFWKVNYIRSRIAYSKDVFILTHTLGTGLYF